MKKIIIDDTFASIQNEEKSQVLEIIPNVFNDARGYFTEVFKADITNMWLKDFSWVKQINRSSSQSYTIRGCHAQKAPYCQGKLVEAINEKIYDIITDARPNSATFGVSKIYILDPIVQNKLWVPRGFLHAFAVPCVESNAIFQYFCDNVYDKESEIGINPKTLLTNLTTMMAGTLEYIDKIADFTNIITTAVISDKDINGFDYETWMNQIKNDYEQSGKLWYR